MPRVEVYEVRCSECEAETEVVETYWPATRIDPADGQFSPEECPKCGKPWDENDEWMESEPPEPDYHREDYDW